MESLLLTAAAVFLAEIGDKTQLVAMAMVAQFGMWRVFSGITAAIIVNSALAVLLGEGLSRVIPLGTLQVAAALGFLAFGFWSLRCPEGEDCEVPGECRGNPFWAIFTAFFLAELGDKTQLVTLGFTAQQNNPLAVFVGASLGLIAAGALGIFLSGFVYRFISPQRVSHIAAALFFIFGSLTLYTSLPRHLVSSAAVAGYLLLLGTLIWLVSNRFARSRA